jgi:exonuclease VII large subunit
LARGYSITTHYATGRIVTSVAQIASGDAVDVRVSDGTFGAKAI